MRCLFAGALGYALPETEADFGLRATDFARPSTRTPYVVFLHGTTWPNKRWPLAHWQRMGGWLRARGRHIVLPWGSEQERTQATEIARACDGEVLPALSLTALAGWLAGAEAFLGVDTGLSHLGAALQVRGLTLYGPTLPGLTGTRGPQQMHLGGSTTTHIDRQRPTAVDPAEVERALAQLLSLPGAPA
jgi:heptosyltransferase-1